MTTPITHVRSYDELAADYEACLAENAALRLDAERWEYILTVWTCYAEVTLAQEEDGRWGLHLQEGIECADAVYFGDDPIKSIDAAMREGKG